MLTATLTGSDQRAACASERRKVHSATSTASPISSARSMRASPASVPRFECVPCASASKPAMPSTSRATIG